MFFLTFPIYKVNIQIDFYISQWFRFLLQYIKDSFSEGFIRVFYTKSTIGKSADEMKTLIIEIEIEQEDPMCNSKLF